MATTALLSGLELQKWRKKYLREYVRDTGFKPYMGKSPNSIIHSYSDLQSGGRTITIPLIGRAKGDGVSGNDRLSGNEEQLDQFTHDIQPEFYRNAFEVSKRTVKFNAADLMSEMRPLLSEWSQEKLKYRIIDAFHTIDGVDYTSASEAQKDAWLGRNSDRVLFGSAVGNNSSNDHSAALGQIDDSNDTLSISLADTARRIARKANPRIRPYKTGTQGREYYVMFCHPYCFRDLKRSSEMRELNRDARNRDIENNPLFQDGDLIADGIIFREIPEFLQAFASGDNTSTTLAGVGASSIQVGANFLCGAQSLGVAWSQMPTPTSKKDDDYGFFKNAGIEEAYGVSKMQRDETQIDHGMVTVYASAVADA